MKVPAWLLPVLAAALFAFVGWWELSQINTVNDLGDRYARQQTKITKLEQNQRWLMHYVGVAKK